MKVARLTCVFAVVLLLSPHAGYAQQTPAGIAGTVRDTTGAVLPGVTVEAASPALIEKVRSVITDANGNYKIVDLRPGAYSVTFVLTGFSTQKREGVELTSGFTATVNADLKVGSLTETVTVSGASPTVDTQNVKRQVVLQAEVLQALPSGLKDFSAVAALTLGAVPSRPGSNDVGGSRGESATGIVLHGGHSADGRALFDGMSTNVFTGNGGGERRNYKFNTVAVEEVAIDTASSTAETETGGANLNMIPKDGGNALKLFGTASFTNQDWSSGKVPADLIARGSAPDQNTVNKIYDYGIGVGGKLIQDKLWFYSAHRWWGSIIYSANNYYNKSTDWRFYVPDLSRRTTTDTIAHDNQVRLTWQAASKHKITFSESVEAHCLCHIGQSGGGQSAPESDTDFHFGSSKEGLYGKTRPLLLTQATWSYPATNRLLFQAGVSFLNQGNARGNDIVPGPDTRSILEQGNGVIANYRYGAPAGTTTTSQVYQPYDNNNQRASLSYITGSHAVKAGFAALEGTYESYGDFYPVQYTFRNQLPVSLTQWATPFPSPGRIRSQGFYAQDQWTLHRFTLNYGLRFDHFTAYQLAVTKPAGPFTPAINFPQADDLPNYKDVQPRLAVAYDVFGNGRTAIKASWGRYVEGQAGGQLDITTAPNSIVSNATRTWNDAFYGAGDPRSGNYLPDCVLTNFGSNGECGALSNSAFGQVQQNLRWDPAARIGWFLRPYSNQWSVQAQHEVRSGLGVSIGFFHTAWHNFQVTENTAVSPSDFTQYCVTAPVDARLPGGGGNPICGLYDVNPSAFGKVSQLIQQGSKFGEQQDFFNGVDMAFNGRFGQGGLLQGGVTVGRSTYDTCYLNNYPNVIAQGILLNAAASTQPRNTDFCRVTPPLWEGVGSQVKLQGVYPIPGDFQLSGVFKNQPGIPIQATYVATNAQIATSLGRNLSACPAAGACALSVNVPLIPTLGEILTGTQFDKRLTQLDLRLSRTFRFGRTRLQGAADLYNVFNARPPQSNSTAYGATWLRPTAILAGRMFKIGAQFDY